MDKAPILIVDDDSDDLEMIRSVAEDTHINRPIHYFRTGSELLFNPVSAL